VAFHTGGRVKNPLSGRGHYKYEIGLIRKMNSWASSENYKAWEEGKDK
jgi:hypothetical protein